MEINLKQKACFNKADAVSLLLLQKEQSEDSTNCQGVGIAHADAKEPVQATGTCTRGHNSPMIVLELASVWCVMEGGGRECVTFKCLANKDHHGKRNFAQYIKHSSVDLRRHRNNLLMATFAEF